MHGLLKMEGARSEWSTKSKRDNGPARNDPAPNAPGLHYFALAIPFYSRLASRVVEIDIWSYAYVAGALQLVQHLLVCFWSRSIEADGRTTTSGRAALAIMLYVMHRI